MMIEFIYDGSFEGLLTTIFYAYGEKVEAKITKASEYTPNFLNDVKNIETDITKSTRVYSSINEKLDKYTLQHVYYLYLCAADNVEDLILKYLKLCYKFGVNINLAKNNDIIILVDKYYRQVSLEAHRFTGFIRFKEISPLTFYSVIEPDHNILPLIIKHFTNRFSDQNFIIHDIKREYAIIYNKKEALLSPLTRDFYKNIDKQSSLDNFEILWKEFYNAVNIKERENKTLQKRSMPSRYWKHLTELK